MTALGSSSWVLVLAALLAVAGVFLLGFATLAYLVHQVQRAVDEARRLAISTHMLVNSAMGAQLRLTAETARSKADITQSPVDLTAAATAERLLAEHAEKQRAADEWQGRMLAHPARGVGG